MNPKHFAPIALLLLVLILAICSCNCRTNEESGDELNVDNKKSNESPRSRFKLPWMLEFAKFKSLFHKSYGSVVEELKRKQLYLANAMKSVISGIRYKFNHGTYSLRVNQMSDWTEKEVSAIYPKQPTLPVDVEVNDHDDYDNKNSMKRQKRETLADSDLEDKKFLKPKQRSQLILGKSEKPYLVSDHSWHKIHSVDYAKWKRVFDEKRRMLRDGSNKEKQANELITDHRACFSKVRNQGKCGSCYAFATISLIEYIHCKETRERVEFSEQYVVDCGHSRPEFKLIGCVGGLSMNVASFVATVGLETRAKYPYYERLYECPLKPDVDAFRMGEYRSNLDSGLVVDLIYMEEYLKFNPMTVSVLVPTDFNQYGNGVHPGNNCDPNQHHAMVLVGQGREDGQEYWLLRNSHSEAWGERGYFKLNKLADCFFPNYGYMMATTDGRTTSLALYKNPIRQNFTLGLRTKPMRLTIAGFKIF